MKGFFSKKTVEEKVADDGCSQCGLYKTCKQPKMTYTGEGRKQCLIIEEPPSNTDEETGTQLSGSAGSMLRELLKDFGYDLDKDFWKVNSLRCRPPKNNKATRRQLKLCRPYLTAAIKELNPKFIFLMGGSAIESFYMERFSKLGVTRWRRLCIPDKDSKAWILPMFHPSDVIKKDQDENLRITFEKDLKWALDNFNKDHPTFEDLESQVKILTHPKKIVRALTKILKQGKKIAFDYETSGLKPFTVGHTIYSIAVTTSKETIAFPYYNSKFTDQELSDIRIAWTKILQSPKIKKIAHNLPFENMWSRVIFDTYVKGWYWCTMNAAHVLDDRTSFCGLKFQAYINFGIEGYEKESARYIKAPENSEFNQLDKMPLNKLLLYNGLDALLTYKLYCKQRKTLVKRTDSRSKAFELTMQGLICMSDIQLNGICVDELYYRETKEDLEKKIKQLTKKLTISKEAIKFVEITGRQLNHASSKDLKELFFDILKLEPVKTTVKGSPSVDHESMEKIDSGYARNLIALRKMEKIHGTYLSQFQRETYNGKLHPTFSLHTTQSYRSSAMGPNFQNIPNRSEEGTLIRSGIFPSIGNKILAIDFGSMEVRIIACYTKDPVLVDYINDPDSDMHRDMAMSLFKLKKDEVTKLLRFHAKNSWTFAQFYGAYYKSCARMLWQNIAGLQTADGIDIYKHFVTKKIIKSKTDFFSFEEHIKNEYNKFWNKFSATREWQERSVTKYLKRGYVQLFTGYRRSGYLTKNMIFNTPVQGCLNGKSKILTKEGWTPINSLVDKKVDVWTGFNWASAIGVDMGECQLSTIELESGLTIECDIRHKLKNQFNEWVDFKNLKEGDWVALPKIEKRIESGVDIDWFFVLGFILGDGSYIRREQNEINIRHTLSICGADTKKDILCALEDFFKTEKLKTCWSIKPIEKNKTQVKHVLTINEKKIKRILDKWNYPICNAHTKKIPISVWNATLKEKANFLDGLLLADGSRKDYSLHMCNESLLKEVQLLGYELGYDSYLRKTKDGYKLMFREIYKKGTINKRKCGSLRKYPRAGIDYFFKDKSYKIKNKNGVQIANKRAIRSKKDFTQTTAERIINEIDPNYEIYRYDKIKKITVHDKIETTYTMSVNDPLHQFVADGVITKNSAFHVLLWSAIQINNKLKTRYNSKIIAQIHDEVVIDLDPSEETEVLSMCKRIMIEDIKKQFPWIIVPLSVEAEITDINQSWATKKEISV